MVSKDLAQALEFAKTLRDDQVIDFLTDNAESYVEEQFQQWLTNTKRAA